MQLGRYQVDAVSGGRFRIDGGTMFGVVPKALWNPLYPADADNLIAQETRCLLLRGDGRTVLIDTGYGSKLGEKGLRRIAGQAGDALVENLAAVGVKPEAVDTVILSHLHFDHAGGATRRGDDGQLSATFPNAEYVVQRGEWEIARAQLAELRGAYPLENLEPLEAGGRVRTIEGEAEVVPGVQALLTPGHTAWHQSLLIADDERPALFLGDLCPTSRHLRTNWCMAYDVHQAETRRQKMRMLGLAADHGWLLVFDHDADCAAATLRRDPRREFVLVDTLTALHSEEA